MGSTITAAMWDASCSADQAFQLFAGAPPQCGSPREKALWPRSRVWGK